MERIAAKGKAALARTLEQTLMDIQHIGDDLRETCKSKAHSTTIHKFVGQAFVRIGLFALDRQKYGCEKNKNIPLQTSRRSSWTHLAT